MGPSPASPGASAGEYRLQHLTWQQFDQLRSTMRVALIPIGATEQHGPHLHVGTDARIAERLAEEIAARAEGLAVMAPPVMVGYSPHHMTFPGTITARESTLRALLDDIVDSLVRHGVRRFLIVNAHGGNIAFLPAWLSDVQRRAGVLAAFAHWSLLGRDVVADIAVSETYGHACEVETSLALALAPDLVEVDRLQPVSPVVPAAHPLIKGQAIPDRTVGVFLSRDFDQITENGALGMPARASVEDGERLREAVVARASEFVTWLAEAPVPASGGPRPPEADAPSS